MTVRSIHAPAACASTVAQLEPGITIAHTEKSTMLLNLPRSIDELDKATGRADAGKQRGFIARLWK
ncbi:hypothetical protein V6D40_09705 [Corynebacterium sp. Q4381]|uniref:hypothetical protein n=1 Tax=Corynebacterium sp. Marseille-Q4381 TaxID=3121597 RepID=UPI002FE54A42